VLLLVACAACSSPGPLAVSEDVIALEGGAREPSRVDTLRARVTVNHSHALGAGRELRLFPGDPIEIYKTSGELYQATPRQRYVADGLTFPAGTRLRFQRDGRVSSALIVESMAYQELLLPPGTELSFARSGELSSLQLTEATTIQALPLEGIVSFHASGRVDRCQLAQRLAMAIPPIQLERGDQLALDTLGRLRELTAARVILVGPYRAATGEPLRFNENGELIEFCDAELGHIVRPLGGE
jgi:hypothetical protein